MSNEQNFEKLGYVDLGNTFKPNSAKVVTFKDLDILIVRTAVNLLTFYCKTREVVEIKCEICGCIETEDNDFIKDRDYVCIDCFNADSAK
jgi:hypothetical protein